MLTFKEFLDENYQLDINNLTPQNIKDTIIKNDKNYKTNHYYEIELLHNGKKNVALAKINQYGYVHITTYTPKIDKSLGVPYILAKTLKSNKKDTWSPLQKNIINSRGQVEEILKFLKRTKNPYLTKEWLDLFYSI